MLDEEACTKKKDLLEERIETGTADLRMELSAKATELMEVEDEIADLERKLKMARRRRKLILLSRRFVLPVDGTFSLSFTSPGRHRYAGGRVKVLILRTPSYFWIAG